MERKQGKPELLVGSRAEMANQQIDEFSGGHTPEEAKNWEEELLKLRQKN
ncbi:MAG TPA: hypothetical protein VMD74_00650 [Candidatus Methylomirabilis sp.]|nr:hypothetical protein [Candidatus Methylomirabilis sp.]